MSPLALNIHDTKTYPSRRDEEWRYSDLRRHLREVPNGASQTVLPPIHIKAHDKQLLVKTCTHQTVHFEQQSIALEKGAQLTVIIILDEAKDATTIRQSTIDLSPGSSFKQYVFSNGAGFQRFETHVNHCGQGAQVELNGAYLIKDKAHFDYTTRVTHNGKDGTTQQIIKGLVKDQATAVFQGRITVAEGADGTDARMHHQAIMLNDGAHVRAKPELEIYADDVQCAHGNTIGALDQSALFYCQSRGMSETQARQLLMRAFIVPVVEAIEDEGARTEVMAWVEAQSEAFYAD